MSSTVYQFPEGFLWGCATAAHQVEGSNTNDWTQWEQTPGHIFQDQQSGLACDWWAGRRYLEDFDRAASMHNNALRLSIEWSRIEPEPGRWNEDAIDRYRDMLRALHDRGLKPMVTLHHFSSPLWVGAQKGWLWEEAPVHFERFVGKVVAALHDLCDLWCTVNEPLVYAAQGYSVGNWPPGMTDRRAVSPVVLHLLEGHARAYHAIKAVQPDSQVGFASHFLGLRPAFPAIVNSLPERLMNFILNKSFAAATTTGIARLPNLKRVRVPNLKGTLDWVGLQYYQEVLIYFDLRSPATSFVNMRKPRDRVVGPGTWGGFNPDATGAVLRELWDVVRKPIYITESGTPDPDDSRRPAFLLHSLRSAYSALGSGLPLRGFFVWSLMDNFEWAEGYDPRFNFGLYRTNFATQERTARPSAGLYGEICGQNALTSAMFARFAPDLEG
ncbi:MAG TPA: family 1 glycosylhydrolase [Aggregatilineales bacterium]|nr:family 1 glycosylhydrolase [Aggregatilineales bacterium]